MVFGRDQPGETMVGALLRSGRVRAREKDLREKAVDLARQLRLIDVIDNRAVELSGGQKKLLEIGRALMADPKLILVDEPAAGVNPTLARQIADQILRLREAGITFLIIEHNMSLVAALCDHVVVLAEGRNLAEGSFAEVKSDHRVQMAYLGQRA